MVEESSTEETSRAAVGVADALQRLVKAQKVLRLYEGTNVVTDRLVVELHDALTLHLESFGTIDLSVREFRLFLDREVVYENVDRNDSLAFLLFRDGIRRLSIEPGLGEDEIRGFLGALNEVRLVSNTEADLVTLFWELDLASIHYFAIDELPAEGGGPRVEEAMASSRELSESEGASSGSIDLLDLEQPVAHLPVEASHLDETETLQLRTEMERERELEFSHDAVELAIELMLNAENPLQRDAIANGLHEILGNFLEQGEVPRIARAAEHLHAFASAQSAHSQVAPGLWKEVSKELRRPAALQRILATATLGHELDVGALGALLARLGSRTISRLVQLLPEVRDSGIRTAVWQAIESHGDRALEGVARGLPDDGVETHAQTAREILAFVRKQASSEAMPIVERLVAENDAETRKEAALTMRKIPGKRAAALWIELVDDEDPELRSLALGALARQHSPVLAQRLYDRSVGTPTFSARSARDKQKLVRTIAILGGDSSLDLFAEPLREAKKSRWLRPKEEQWILEAMVYGIGCVGGPGAHALLTDLKDSGDRLVRSLCEAELERLGT